MGQQVPFETLSALGQALITEHFRRDPDLQVDDLPEAIVRRVQLTSVSGAPELSRVEITLAGAPGSVEAHLYEAYWAPFTEGQISFLQTVAFLYTVAWNGVTTYLLASRRRGARHGNKSGDSSQAHTGKQDQFRNDHLRHFDRWMFGDFHDMPIKRGTFWMLMAVVASVSVVLIPALLLFTPAGIYITEQSFQSYKNYLKWPLPGQLALAFAALLFFLLAWLVHYFVVEFVGDVAIYVSSYRVSRFDSIRTKILDEVYCVARQIYAAGIVDQTHPSYDAIVIVGHSLGSVISYDVLNSCINWDQLECGSHQKVVPRTVALITFGSPLDKTAFLFRTQVRSARNLREALAARQQPLILDYPKFRPLDTFRWFNIHAPADIISGHLDYYDAVDACDPKDFNPVRNIVDPDAKIPLFAHVQYWENSTLHKTLYDAAWAGVQVR